MYTDPLFLYSFLILISSILFSLKFFHNSKSILNLGIIFNLLIIVYAVIGVNIYSQVFNSNLESLEEILKVVFLSSIAYNLVFNYTNSLYSFNKVIKTPEPHLINSLFTIISLTYLSIIIFKGILFVDRTQAFYLLYQNKYIFLLSSFQTVLYILIAFNHYYKRKARFYFKTATLYLVIMSLITISRHDLFSIFVVNIFFLIKSNRVSSQKILIYTTLLIVFFLFFKQILYTQLLAQERALGPDYSELINWVRNTINTINSKIKYEYNPYLVTIEGVFNPFIIFDKPLSNWYIKNFFYKNYLAGNKYGFSFIAESYVAGSPYLLIIVYSFYGYLSKKISFKKVSPVNSVVQITVILMMYKLFRSESYNFFRSIVWSYFIPLIIIQFFSVFNLNKNTES